MCLMGEVLGPLVGIYSLGCVDGVLGCLVFVMGVVLGNLVGMLGLVIRGMVLFVPMLGVYERV